MSWISCLVQLKHVSRTKSTWNWMCQNTENRVGPASSKLAKPQQNHPVTGYPVQFVTMKSVKIGRTETGRFTYHTYLYNEIFENRPAQNRTVNLPDIRFKFILTNLLKSAGPEPDSTVTGYLMQFLLWNIWKSAGPEPKSPLTGYPVQFYTKISINIGRTGTGQSTDRISVPTLTAGKKETQALYSNLNI